MKQGMIYDWEYIGALLANQDDNDQAKVFKAMIKEMQSWGTSWQTGMQLSSVNQLLTDDEILFLSALTYREGIND